MSASALSAQGVSIVSVPLHSNAQPLQRIRLTVEEAVRRGVEYSKTLHTAQAKLHAAEARVGEAAVAMLPKVDVTATYARLSDIPLDRQFQFQLDVSQFFRGTVDPMLLADPSVQRSLLALRQLTTPPPSSGEQPQPSSVFPVILDNYQFQAAVTYPVFTGFRLEAAKAAAEYNAQAASQDIMKERSETEFTIHNAYWTLYKVRHVQRLTAETIEQVNARLADAQSLLKNGLLTQNDILRLQLQLSNAKIAKIDADNAERLAALQLNTLLGLPLHAEVELASEIQYTPNKLPDYETALQRALEARAEVRGTQLRIKAAEEAVRAARGGYFPTVAISGAALEANPNPRLSWRGAEWNFTWQLAAQLSWTLWNWNTTGYQVAQAEAQVVQAEDALSMLHDGIKLEVTQNYLALQQAREKVAVAQQGMEQANENYRVTNEKFKKGLALTSDVTEAQTLQLQAKVHYITSIVDYELAQARLAKSLGERSPLINQAK
ncbi:MAG: TolC family protein [Bacteroidota bacterium]|nr:TolC family protein [Candidatus Kapabacteria bacterium]MDW8220942.1 TolC family protein [Bacteroidota bacterium]